MTQATRAMWRYAAWWLISAPVFCTVRTINCASGNSGYDRPDFDLPGSPFASVDAADCESHCQAARTCKQWSWSNSQSKCWLKNLVSPRVSNPDFCSGTRKAKTITEQFPFGNYTPFTYLQNPYHRVFHYSGQLRSDDVVNGLGWYGNYQGVFAVSARPQGIGGKPIIKNDDIQAAGMGRHSDLHTKARVRVKWSEPSAAVSAEYWQVAEDLFACEVVVQGQAGATTASFDVLLAVNATWSGTANAKFSAVGDGQICADANGGISVGVSVVSASSSPAGHAFFSSVADADEQLQSQWKSGGSNFSSAAGNQIVASLTFQDVDVKNEQRFLFAIGRGKDCSSVSTLFNSSDLATVPEMINQRALSLEDDGRFWSGAPVPSGDFEDAWKHGVVYDLNTVRLNLRPATGIFTTEWDSMQIQSPRIVVAEATMDFLAMSYADPVVAKEVILGLFSDAIAPNVPCVWENGKPNLVCDDGSVGGTPPAWGNPLKNILSVYQRDSDKQWLAKLYPLLGDYLNYWLEHRKMSGTEYQTCRCSWECGQDDEPRWSFNQSSGGSVTDRFRVVEMQAATAHAGAVLAYFANELGRPQEEKDRWREVNKKYTNLTLSLWQPMVDSPFGGWFSDFDTLTNARSPYGAWNMQLAPLFFHDPSLGVDLFPAAANINASKLAESIQQTFWSTPPGITPNMSFCEHSDPEWGKDLCWTVSGQLRPEHDAFRLDRVWAPSPWTMGDGAAAVGRRDIASSFTERTLSSVYPVMDMRTKDPKLPLPGCAYECWDTGMMDKSMPPVSNYLTAEAYGWSSVATVLFLRTIVGFRELTSFGAGSVDDHSAFELAPALPERLLMRPFCPQKYAVERLHFQGRMYHLTYIHSCAAKAAGASGTAAKLHVRLTEVGLANDSAGSDVMRAKVEFEAVNGKRYRISIKNPGQLHASLLSEP